MDPRRIRTRAPWLLALPFFWFATPTPTLLAVGAALAAAGLGVRAWAAGTIHKGSRLAVSGPYAHLRNPLYAGTLLAGAGVAAAGGHWAWPVAFALLYAWLYGRTIAHEEEVLEGRFGDDFRRYRAQVPALVPRLTPYRAGDADGGDGFSWAGYRRNREWQPLLALAATFAVLAAKAA